MKAPLIGPESFIKEWIERKLGELYETLDVLGKLPNPHVAYYLLKQAAGVCKVLIWMRTMPGCMVGDLFGRFDQNNKEVFENPIGAKTGETGGAMGQGQIAVNICDFGGVVRIAKPGFLGESVGI